MNNMMHGLNSVIQDFSDAKEGKKANARSQQTGGLYVCGGARADPTDTYLAHIGLPLKVRCTSLMFESRTGYQLFTVKLTPKDKVSDPANFARQPDIMMKKIDTTDEGTVLYIRYKTHTHIYTDNTFLLDY